jgi:hypothetical protein
LVMVVVVGVALVDGKCETPKGHFYCGATEVECVETGFKGLNFGSGPPTPLCKKGARVDCSQKTDDKGEPVCFCPKTSSFEGASADFGLGGCDRR